MIEEILFAGFGGQGILLAGRFVAQAAMNDGYYATWFPSYGPEMRGGTANCAIVYSDAEIGSPIASEYDTIIVMNQPSLDKFQEVVKPGGTLIVNTSLINIDKRRDDINILEVKANELAISCGSDRSANIVIIGAYNAAKDIIKNETLENVITTGFARKGDKVVEMNKLAFDAGQKALNGA